MKIYRTWQGLSEDARGATVALGNFDGVHLGHAHLLHAAHAARPATSRHTPPVGTHPERLN